MANNLFVDKCGMNNQMLSQNKEVLHLKLFIPVLIILIFVSHSSSANDLSIAKQSGKDLANSLLGQVQNNAQQDINNKHASTDTSVATSINYKGTDVLERNYTNENMDAAKNQKAADKNNTEASIVSTSFLRAKEYPVSLSDSFLDKANDAGKNPENYVDWLSGKYTDCNQEGGEEVLNKSTHTCDEFKEIKDKVCIVGRNIQVDSRHKYTCPRKINKFKKVCSKNLLLECEKWEEGIIVTSSYGKGIKLPKNAFNTLNSIVNRKEFSDVSKVLPLINLDKLPCKYTKIPNYPPDSKFGYAINIRYWVNDVEIIHIPGTEYFDKDLKRYFKIGSNIISNEIGYCSRYEMHFDYVLKGFCNAWKEIWHEECKEAVL